MTSPLTISYIQKCLRLWGRATNMLQPANVYDKLPFQLGGGKEAEHLLLQQEQECIPGSQRCGKGKDHKVQDQKRQCFPEMEAF